MTTAIGNDPDISDLDHLMFNCLDINAATRRLESLGFKMRPLRPLPPMGGGIAGGRGGSAIVLLTSQTKSCANYLEFAYCDHAFADPVMKGILSGPPGVAMSVHHTQHPEQVRHRWTSDGHELEYWAFTMPSTPTAPAGSVEIVLPHSGSFPWPINAVRLGDLAPFRDPALQQHPNGAIRFSAVTYAVADDQFDETVAALTRIYGKEAEGSDPHFRGFCWTNASVMIATASSLIARFPSVRGILERRLPAAVIVQIRVASVARLLSVLKANKVKFVHEDTGVMVEPDSSIDVCLLFEEGAE